MSWSSKNYLTCNSHLWDCLKRKSYLPLKCFFFFNFTLHHCVLFDDVACMFCRSPSWPMRVPVPRLSPSPSPSSPTPPSPKSPTAIHRNFLWLLHSPLNRRAKQRASDVNGDASSVPDCRNAQPLPLFPIPGTPAPAPNPMTSALKPPANLRFPQWPSPKSAPRAASSPGMLNLHSPCGPAPPFPAGCVEANGGYR